MSHYETLGVGKDAGDDEIKKAFRRRSRAAHPDKQGGDHTAMVAVNRAYETLKDPDKRSRYDRTGNDQATPERTLDEKSRALIVLFFDQLVEKADDYQDLVELTRANLTSNLHAIKASISELRERIKRIEKRRRRLKYTGTERNFLLDLLDAKVRGYNEKATEGEEQVTVFERALEMMREFAYEAEDRPSVDPSFGQIVSILMGTGPYGTAGKP